MAGITNRRSPRAKRVSLVDPRNDPGANLVPHCSIFREAFQVPGSATIALFRSATMFMLHCLAGSSVTELSAADA